LPASPPSVPAAGTAAGIYFPNSALAALGVFAALRFLGLVISPAVSTAVLAACVGQDWCVREISRFTVACQITTAILVGTGIRYLPKMRAMNSRIELNHETVLEPADGIIAVEDCILTRHVGYALHEAHAIDKIDILLELAGAITLVPIANGRKSHAFGGKVVLLVVIGNHILADECSAGFPCDVMKSQRVHLAGLADTGVGSRRKDRAEELRLLIYLKSIRRVGREVFEVGCGSAVIVRKTTVDRSDDKSNVFNDRLDADVSTSLRDDDLDVFVFDVPQRSHFGRIHLETLGLLES